MLYGNLGTFKWDMIQTNFTLGLLHLRLPLLLELTDTSKEDVKQKNKDYDINIQIGFLIHEFKF